MTTANAIADGRTDRQWWEAQCYYAASEASPDLRTARWFMRYLPRRSDWSVIEIGACPGSYLLTLACSHGYHPVALDFLPEVQRLPAVFRKHGIEDLEVIETDFFTMPDDRHFNVVMSFGFIEHFNDAEAVLRKHWALVADEGYLVISLPIFGPMQLALRRIVLTPETLTEKLRTHNTSIMDMRLFREWAGRLPGAMIVKCGYSGYMRTLLYSSDPWIRRRRGWIVRAWKLASFVPRILHVSCRLFSPYGVLVLRRQSTVSNAAGVPKQSQFAQCK